MKSATLKLCLLLCVFYGTYANATLVAINGCTGALACNITTTPPNPIVPNPNDNLLLAWDEVQNYVLTQDLVVDRVFDPNASFVTILGNNQYAIKAGTVVSSHYLQWDPETLPNQGLSVQADIVLDSQVFAFIDTDQSLLDSDFLGLANVVYNGFTSRGLEPSDITTFNGNAASIDWFAGNPGDWSRLITAYSPSAPNPINSPTPFLLLSLGLFMMMVRRIVRDRT